MSELPYAHIIREISKIGITALDALQHLIIQLKEFFPDVESLKKSDGTIKSILRESISVIDFN
jgi:hypothetical protein